MLRVFLVLLAILLAVLAFVFDRSWLYVGAGLPLAGVLGLVGWQMWTRYQRHQQREATRRDENDVEEDLEQFGIVDVRPEDAEDASASAATSTAPEEPTAAAPIPADATADPRTSTPSSNPAPPALDHPAVTAPDEASGKDESSETSRAAPDDEELAEDDDRDPAGTSSSDDTGLSPLLASARAALGAQTVCLLVQEDVTLEYRIEACASATADVQTTGTFETKRPLLSARMSRQAVAVQSLDDETRSALGYYRHPPESLTQMAVAPVQRPDDPATIFLLADTDGATDLASSRARRLLEHYAEMADLLLDSAPPAPQESTDQETDPPNAMRDSDGSETSNEDLPPPRRTIIAEEMDAAQDTADDLALALVHLNRAESIARRGEDTVATTERRMRARLEQEVPGQRIERFGELTYGIFLRGDAEEAEQWAVALQDAMADETGALEGGISVGVAVQGPSHTEPERLRADATEALREAYETGTCTIVA